MMRLATSALAAIILAVASSVVAETNTNTCLALLGGLNAGCGSGLSVPSLQCCIAVSNFNKAGCFCNSAISTLAGSTKYLGFININNIATIDVVVRPACAVLGVNPFWWNAEKVNQVNWGKVSCTPFNTKTYNGGSCSMIDMDMDNARIQSAVGIGKLLQNIVTDTSCFDYNAFLKNLAALFDPNPVVTVGFGIGAYTDINSSAEYLALVSPKVNKQFWNFQFPDPTTDPNAVLYVVPGGQSIIVGATGGGAWWNSCTVGASGYMEQDVSFEGCGTLAKNYFVPGTSTLTGQPTNLHNFVNKFYIAAQNTDTWGIENVCGYHETYCTGPYRQFASRSECLRFMRALPAISPSCGNGLIMSGNSSTCRFKHAFMSPLEPGAHCFHIGYGDLPDVHGHFKCNDNIECVSSNPALSDGTLLSLAENPNDAQCTAQDVASYTTWQAPTGICAASLPSGRRLRGE